MADVNVNDAVFKTKKEKNWLRDILRTSDVTIEFEKKDGSIRTMICTLSEDVIPEEKLPKGTGKAKSDDVLAVFDLELNEWRSFRFDSIKKIQFEV